MQIKPLDWFAKSTHCHEIPHYVNDTNVQLGRLEELLLEMSNSVCIDVVLKNFWFCELLSMLAAANPNKNIVQCWC